MNCPYCHEYGAIIQYHIPKLKKDYFVCNECERYWESLDDVGKNDDPLRIFGDNPLIIPLERSDFILVTSEL